MKLTVLTLLLLAALGCSKKDEQQQPVASPSPVVTASPEPSHTPVTGKWCPAERADFSPCNPAIPDITKSCVVGEQFTGCKSFDCKESC